MMKSLLEFIYESKENTKEFCDKIINELHSISLNKYNNIIKEIIEAYNNKLFKRITIKKVSDLNNTVVLFGVNEKTNSFVMATRSNQYKGIYGKLYIDNKLKELSDFTILSWNSFVSRIEDKKFKMFIIETDNDNIKKELT